MRSTVTISSLIACTFSRVVKSCRRLSLVTASCSFTPLLRRMSMEAFSFSSFLRKAGIFMRSSGDCRYSPMACAADIVGAAIATPLCRLCFAQQLICQCVLVCRWLRPDPFLVLRLHQYHGIGIAGGKVEHTTRTMQLFEQTTF